AAGGAELGGEGIAPAAAGGLGGPAGRVRAAARDARDEGVAGPIHRDGVTAVFVEAAEIGRVGEAGAGRGDLGDEGVGGDGGETRVVRVEGGKGGRIGGHARRRRVGAAGDVGVARQIDGDAAGGVRAAAAEIGGVQARCAGGVEPGDVRISCAAVVGRVVGP